MKIKSVLKPKHVAWVSGVLLAAILGVAVSRSAAKPSTQAPYASEAHQERCLTVPVVEFAQQFERKCLVFERLLRPAQLRADAGDGRPSLRLS